MHIQIFPDLVFKDAKVDIILVASSSDSNDIAETVNGLGRISSPPHAINRKDSRIVPSWHYIRENQLMEFPFR